MYKLLLKNNMHGYWPVKSITLEGDILTNFLLTDVGSQASRWIEWVNDPEDTGGSCNATFFLKDPLSPGDILLCDALDDGDIDDNPYLRIKNNNLIELLKKWDELYKQRVPYIVLTVEDNGVSIEGKESLGECEAD